MSDVVNFLPALDTIDAKPMAGGGLQPPLAVTPRHHILRWGAKHELW